MQMLRFAGDGSALEGWEGGGAWQWVVVQHSIACGSAATTHGLRYLNDTPKLYKLHGKRQTVQIENRAKAGQAGEQCGLARPRATPGAGVGKSNHQQTAQLATGRPQPVKSKQRLEEEEEEWES